ncbi:hypothetical protein [Roseinatronobacter alkalisoli]|uniref:Uncharacterized protein n=1 Tax=Roseinatronobacter alkalisoli TaxID=3028235 RepID=A0ABT5TDV5_9RHOB|nr:hypothetical protein [Roseinatronobacter sp. HJB301]MDD7972347.1 hypothetical protein [Roseinatronobacter sp. HJB301]
MPKRNSAALLIRLLSDAYEADRLIRPANFSAQNKAQADKFRHQQLTALRQFSDALEPLDCVQLMAVDIHDRRPG